MPKLRNWLLVSILSAIAAMAVVTIAYSLPTPFAVLVMLVGVVVFLVTLWHNPAYRYWRGAMFVLTGWMTARALPNLLIHLQWDQQTWLRANLLQDVGWTFDLAAVFITAVLVAADCYREGKASGLGRLLSPFRHLSRSKQYAVHASAQQLQIGHVSGSNNTLNITQNQGLGATEVAQLIQTHAFTANAEIDVACERIKDGQPEVAINLLETMRRRHWDRLSDRERYRLEANIGHALEKKGEYEAAARHFIEAVKYQPEAERARSLEATAYSMLGDRSKAFALATGVRQDQETSAIATAVWIRTAPDSVPFATLEAEVPAALMQSVEVLHELSLRASQTGEHAAAERHARAALEHGPHLSELRERLGVAILQSEINTAKAGLRPPSKERLREAVDAFTGALEQVTAKKDRTRLRFNRANALDFLGNTGQAEEDFRAALDLESDDPECARRFAVFLDRNGRLDAAINALHKPGKVLNDLQNRLRLANLLGERNRLNDRQTAISLLSEAIHEAKDADAATRGSLIDILSKLYTCTGSHKEAIDMINALPAGYLSEVVTLTLLANVHRQAGDANLGLKLAREGLQKLGPGATEEERLRMAEALTLLGEYKDALPLWKQLVRPTNADDFVHKALQCARLCEDDSFILEFCEQLRANGVRDPVCLDLEVRTRERYGDLEAAIALMQEYLLAPENDDLAKLFQVRLSLIGLRAGKPNLLETDATKLPSVNSVPVALGAAVAYILRNGARPIEAVEYAYELLRRHFSDPEAHQIYVAIAGFGDELTDLFVSSSHAEMGQAVQYREEATGEEKWIILEDAPNPKIERDEIGPDNPWADELRGKQVGDLFYLRRDPLQDRTARILSICSKYVHRKVEVMNNWEDRFPGGFFVRKFQFATEPDGTPDIEPLLRSLDLREEHTKELDAFYRDHPISVSTFARLSQVSLLDAFYHVASEETLGIRCCKGNAEELEAADQAFHSATGLVIDPSALATLLFSGQFENMAHLATHCVTSHSALDVFREALRRASSPSSGFVGKNRGRYYFTETDPDAFARQHQRISEFLNRLPTLVTIKSGRPLAELESSERQQMIQLFGQPAAEAVARARQDSAVLWTDDLGVAEYASSRHNVRRVWTQHLFHRLVLAQKIPQNVHDELTLFLVQHHYFFTRVDTPAFLAACRKAVWDPMHSTLAAVIGWFGSPEIMYDGLLNQCATVLPIIWKTASFAHQKENVTGALIQAVLNRNDGVRLVTSLANNTDRLFGLDVVSAIRCKEIIQNKVHARIAIV